MKAGDPGAIEKSVGGVDKGEWIEPAEVLDAAVSGLFTGERIEREDTKTITFWTYKRDFQCCCT